MHASSTGFLAVLVPLSLSPAQDTLFYAVYSVALWGAVAIVVAVFGKNLVRSHEALAARTYEFSEYLVDVRGLTDLGAHFNGTFTYHSSCHLLRDMGVDRQPRALLRNVGGARFVELPYSEDCCGFGGVFSVEHPEISAEMLKRKIANVKASQAAWVVSCDAGCVTNINGGLHRQGKLQRAVHIAEILAHQ